MSDVLQAVAHHILNVSHPCALNAFPRDESTQLIKSLLGVAARNKLREG